MVSERAEFVIWGAAGHAKVLAEIIRLTQGEVVALFDNRVILESPLPGIPVLLGQDGFETWLQITPNRKKVAAVAAIGGSRGADRLELLRLFRSSSLLTPSLIHPTAHVSDTAVLGANCHVLASSVLAVDSVLGEACILNTRSSVDHECILGNGVHIAPGATLCGCVSVGDNTLVGANAVVLPRVRIGRDVIVGAGSVVTRDIPDGVLAFGNPARRVRLTNYAESSRRP